MSKLENKVALVTGGASGIGASTARRLADEGAKVVITDLSVEQGEATAQAIGSNAIFLRHDVSDEAQWAQVVSRVESTFGPISVLVNNAGIVGPRQVVEDYALSDYRKVIDVNQIGVFLGMKSVVPSMRKAGGGSIINVASVMGLVGSPEAVAYCASKFAVTGMTKAVALELGRHGIRVNSVHPGPIRTPLLLATDQDGLLQASAQQLATGRLGEANEIASVILFLASDEASYCTGGAFTADGGWTAA